MPICLRTYVPGSCHECNIPPNFGCPDGIGNFDHYYVNGTVREGCNKISFGCQKSPNRLIDEPKIKGFPDLMTSMRDL